MTSADADLAKHHGGDHGGDGDQEEGADPRRWRILAVALVVGFMSLLDVTIVNVALPSIRAGLDTSPGTAQWIVSGYALTFGLTLVSGGRLGDAYGRRRLMVVGLAAFIGSSALVGFAPNAELVVAARLLQGAAAGLLTPQNSGLIQDLFRGPERGRAFGLFGFTVSISSALGPLVGGTMIALLGPEIGWRAIFLVNVPIGLVAMVFVARLVPGKPPGDDSGPVKLDLPGALLLGGGVLCLLYPLVSLESGALLPLVLLPGVPILLATFVWWEHRTVRRGHAPLLDVTLLRQVPGYANGIAVGTIYFTGFTGIFLVLSVYTQESLGLTALMSGLVLTPFAIGSAFSSPLAGRLVSRMHRRITVVALTINISGVVAVALLAPLGFGNGWLVVLVLVPLLVAGLGGGGVVSPNLTLTLSEVPPRMGGAAGGAVQTGQRIGSALGAALLMTIYQVAVGSGMAGVDALRAALLAAAAILSVALVLAFVDLRAERRR
ncbi:MFS transporter [uncultured Nocardioides sp.]|uniref:MFS transporter n=1 Tax=uncultured Nocardioides sp. TaxID=198441 RepID=UPI00262A9ED9|nr:MFS transporter [uncultured Nocardioides sp.]